MNASLIQFEIPLIVSPANMSSPELDELSSITYLSYFVKEGSPGYKATLKWIQTLLPDDSIKNFSVRPFRLIFNYILEFSKLNDLRVSIWELYIQCC
jgi:hypothetical protein